MLHVGLPRLLALDQKLHRQPLINLITKRGRWGAAIGGDGGETDDI